MQLAQEVAVVVELEPLEHPLLLVEGWVVGGSSLLLDVALPDEGGPCRPAMAAMAVAAAW